MISSCECQSKEVDEDNLYGVDEEDYLDEDPSGYMK